MRILFAFVGGDGHFDPLVGIARAAKAAGHTVAFGCGPSMASTVSAAAFTVFAMGEGASRPRERLPLQPVDSEREDRDLCDRFVRGAAPYRVPLTIALCNDWQPDVLVCDETDFGAVVAAERVGLPHATVLVCATGSFVRAEVVGEALDELRAQHELPPDPDLAMLSRYLVLSPFPESYRDPAYPLPATAHAFRSWVPELVGGPPPAWSVVLPGAPRVYFTLGTIFNTESGDLLARVLAALRGLSINLVVTVGRHVDPAEFGPQPAHVHV